MYHFFVLLWKLIIEFFFPTYFEEDASDEGTGETPTCGESDELPTDDPSSGEADAPVVPVETPVVEDDIVTYPANAPVAGGDDETVTAIEIKE